MGTSASFGRSIEALWTPACAPRSTTLAGTWVRPAGGATPGRARAPSTSSTVTATRASGPGTRWTGAACTSTKTETGGYMSHDTYSYCVSDARFEGVFNKGEFSGDGLFFFGSLDKYDGEFSQ